MEVPVVVDLFRRVASRLSRLPIGQPRIGCSLLGVGGISSDSRDGGSRAIEGNACSTCASSELVSP